MVGRSVWTDVLWSPVGQEFIADLIRRILITGKSLVRPGVKVGKGHTSHSESFLPLTGLLSIFRLTKLLSSRTLFILSVLLISPYKLGGTPDSHCYKYLTLKA